MPHLIVFSHLRWNSLCHRPQQLLPRLARHWPVLYVEEPLCTKGSAARLEATAAAPGVTVLRPHAPVELEGFHDEAMSFLMPLLADYRRAHGITDHVAWFCTPMALPVLDVLDPRAVVYDCMDDLASLPRAPLQMHAREAALLGAADLVMTAGPSLFDAKRVAHPNVLCVPNAVDAPRRAPQSASARLGTVLHAEHVQGRIPGPRLGFYGAIDERVDMALVDAIAAAEPDWQLLMAGPVVGIDEASLPRRPNIHWLGPQPPSLLPQLMADWEVCLLPFACNESTRCLSPIQTLEYMAAEKPIVSTALHDVVAMYGDVVRIGHDQASFIEGCRWALSETGYKRAERIVDMLATVSRFSWDSTAESVLDAIHKVLAGPAAARGEGGRPAPVMACTVR
jgi:glycosyltransferase involved in cell wall biosynthesis